MKPLSIERDKCPEKPVGRKQNDGARVIFVPLFKMASKRIDQSPVAKGDRVVASSALAARSKLEKERQFYFLMTIAISAAALIGFSSNIVRGRSSFASPWFIHLHAVTMMGWIGLYLVQNLLVWRNDVSLHRRLGILAAVWSIWLVPLGLALVAGDVALHRVPPFFDPGFFFAMDSLTIVMFGALTWTAVGLRHRPDWHKRLMFGGTLILIGPAWGRIVPFDRLGKDCVWIDLAILLTYLVAAAWFDCRVHGRVHAAHRWTAAALILSVALIYPLRLLPPYQAFIGLLAS